MVKAASGVAIWRPFELDPLPGEANGAAAGSPEDNERVRRNKEAVADRRADDHDQNSQSNYQECSPLLDFARFTARLFLGQLQRYYRSQPCTRLYRNWREQAITLRTPVGRVSECNGDFSTLSPTPPLASTPVAIER